MLEVLLIDDHPSVMEGTKLLLEKEGDINVRFALSPEDALSMPNLSDFDVMLIDFQMPDMNGIELAKQILCRAPEAVILLYSGYDCMPYFNAMIEAGVCGFVMKTANREQLVTAVRCAARGETVLPTSLVKQLRKLSAVEYADPSLENTVSITDKERKVLKEIAAGRSNREIAESLIMSQRSLEYRLTGLFQKLGVKSRIEAVSKARQLGLLDDISI